MITTPTELILDGYAYITRSLTGSYIYSYTRCWLPHRTFSTFIYRGCAFGCLVTRDAHTHAFTGYRLWTFDLVGLRFYPFPLLPICVQPHTVGFDLPVVVVHLPHTFYVSPRLPVVPFTAAHVPTHVTTPLPCSHCLRFPVGGCPTRGVAVVTHARVTTRLDVTLHVYVLPGLRLVPTLILLTCNYRWMLDCWLYLHVAFYPQLVFPPHTRAFPVPPHHRSLFPPCADGVTTLLTTLYRW